MSIEGSIIGYEMTPDTNDEELKLPPRAAEFRNTENFLRRSASCKGSQNTFPASNVTAQLEFLVMIYHKLVYNHSISHRSIQSPKRYHSHQQWTIGTRKNIR